MHFLAPLFNTTTTKEKVKVTWPFVHKAKCKSISKSFTHQVTVVLLSSYLNIKILPVPAEMSETALISLKDTSFSFEHQADSIDIDSVSVNMTPGYCNVICIFRTKGIMQLFF